MGGMKRKEQSHLDVLERQKKLPRLQNISELSATHNHPVADETRSQVTALRPQIEQSEIAESGPKKLWDEPPLSTWLEDDEHYPTLPVIADAEILFTFWNNTSDTPLSRTNPDTVALNHKGNLSNAWKALQKRGNTHMRAITHQLLYDIFGKNNYPLHAFVFDHANSSVFIETVTIHYGLERRLKNPPMKTDDSWKLRAGIFDAWIGSHIYERQLFNRYDPLLELTSFWRNILLLRYRKLMVFIYNPTICPTYIPQNEKESTVVNDVVPAENDHIRQTFGQFVDVSKGKKILGFLATVQFTAAQQVHTVFSPSKNEADEMGALRMGTRPLYEDPISYTGEPIFKKYQRNCFELVRQFLDAEKSRERHLRELNNLCGQWIEEIKLFEDHSEKSKVLAMLFRQKSFTELWVGNYFNSFELLRDVINYAIKNLPRSYHLLKDTIERIELISEKLDIKLSYTISKDNTEGEINLGTLLAFKWKEEQLEVLWP